MRHIVLFLLSLSLFISCTNDYDFVIRNAAVYDGLGGEPYFKNVAIKAGKIAAIGAFRMTDAPEIDGNGLALAPGFIDLHSHIEPIELYPEAESFIRQGVTTVLGGPDGGSPFPIGRHLDTLEMLGVGPNVGYLIGHNTVRNHVMGLADRAPSADEMEEMKGLIARSMNEGAFGISTGLKYIPGAYSTTEEVIELSKVAGQEGGIYTSHLRDEGLKLLDGVSEAIEIAEKADIPVVLTHHKAIGEPMWGSSAKTLAMVDSARARGLDVMMDQYPYTASYTSISVLIPAWALAGGRYEKFAERCANPVLRDSIHKGIIFNIKYDRGGNDLRRVQIAKFNWKPHLVGKTLYDWALEERLEPTAENGAELVIQAQLHRGASCIYHVMADEDVAAIMSHPQTMHASDGRLSIIGKGHPHPRAFGTFPRILGHYVREKKVLPLQEAIRKMTSLPAQRIGLDDRGSIEIDQVADLVLFNPKTVIDKATFQDPNQFPEGIEYVWVNGEIALENGAFLARRNGAVLRHKKRL